MASGYKNSAGTDLDSIFYTSNGNAGALGFLNSSNKDLGNLYTSKNTYGTTVGYKNSAGTDIGNLRGVLIAPAGSVTATAGTNTEAYKAYSYSDDNEGSD